MGSEPEATVTGKGGRLGSLLVGKGGRAFHVCRATSRKRVRGRGKGGTAQLSPPFPGVGRVCVCVM